MNLYVSDGRLPIDNNDTEQLMKQIALGRKNWLFIGSVEAGNRAAILQTIVSTALRNDLDVSAYVKDVLDQLLAGSTDYHSLRRRRLASLSSFMAALCEPMARRANREDKATGRFWEGRFRSQAIVDETALLACSIYVDLNPIRACLAETPESSEFTAAYERIIARQQAAACVTGAATGTEGTAAAEPSPTDARDAWLSPVPDGDVPVELQSTPTSGSTRRASDRGFLPMTLDEYLTLLDWTGRAIRSDKRGAIPADLLPILQRLQVNAEVWVETIEHFGRIFRRAAGRVSNLAALAAARGKCWFQGVTASKLAFR